MALRFDAGSDVESHVKELLSRLSVVLFAGLPDPEGRINVSVFSSLGDTSSRGLSHLFIPILIASLIVLNTMMGSVYERFREIGVYSAVGLAPVHVAFLFIAEACVYAVLGTVSGYLLGQGVAKLLLWQDLLSGVLAQLLRPIRGCLVRPCHGRGHPVHPLSRQTGVADGCAGRVPPVENTGARRR